MIIDKIENAKKYFYLNAYFENVFNFIINNELNEFGVGEYEIEKDKSYLIIAENEPSFSKIDKLEAHRKYIDIQFPIKGTFGITWKSIFDTNLIIEEYSPVNDVIFFSDIPDFEFKLMTGNFAILFPEDAHYAQPPSKFLKKGIIKVRI